MCDCNVDQAAADLIARRREAPSQPRPSKRTIAVVESFAEMARRLSHKRHALLLIAGQTRRRFLVDEARRCQEIRASALGGKPLSN